MVDAFEQFYEAAARLRRTIEGAAYEEAQRALLELRRALERSRGEGGAEALADEAMRLLAWARRTALAGRAHDAARLARLRRLPEGYSGWADNRGPSVRLEA